MLPSAMLRISIWRAARHLTEGAGSLAQGIFHG